MVNQGSALSRAIEMRDPYDVLGVPKKASDAEIKKAFRGLAKKYHPDAHGNDPSMVKRFQELNDAYEVVGDKEKRAQFDRGEINGAGQPRGFDPRGQGFSGFRPSAGPSGFDFRRSAAGGGRGGEGFSAEDIFADLLGGLGGMGKKGRRRAQALKGADATLATNISLEEAAIGGTRRVVLADGKTIEVRVPVGVKDGQQIRLRGQGGAGQNGGPPGDVLISIKIAPHHQFVREESNLRMELPVTLKEAVLGAKIAVPTLTAPVEMTIPPGSNSGQVLRLRGKGLPDPSGKTTGDLYVRLIVALPEGADPKLKAFVAGWANAYNPRAKAK